MNIIAKGCQALLRLQCNSQWGIGGSDHTNSTHTEDAASIPSKHN